MSDLTNDPTPTPDAAGLTEAQVQAIAQPLLDRLAALEKRAAERPASSKEQLNDHLKELFNLKADGVETKRDGVHVADEADRQIKELQHTLRQQEIKAAAEKHNFRSPDIAASLVTDPDADIDKALAEIVKTHPYLVAEKKSDPDMGGAGAASTGDPGIDALASQIAAANRR